MINYYLPTDEYVILILILTIITMINYYLPTEYVIPIFIIAIFYYQNMKSFTNAFNGNDTNSKVWRSDHQHEKHYKQVRKCWEDKSVSVYIISNENDWKTCSAPVHFDSASGGATLKRFGFKNIDTRALISFSETFTFLLEVSSLIERTLIKSKWYSEQYSRYFIDKKQDIFRPSKEKKSHRPPPPEDPPPKKKKEKKERKEVKKFSSWYLSWFRSSSLSFKIKKIIIMIFIMISIAIIVIVFWSGTQGRSKRRSSWTPRGEEGEEREKGKGARYKDKVIIMTMTMMISMCSQGIAVVIVVKAEVATVDKASLYHCHKLHNHHYLTITLIIIIIWR